MPLSGLRLRVLSAIVLAVPVLLAVYLGRPVFDGALGLVALVMAFEWDRLCAGGAASFRSDAASWTLGAAVAVVATLCVFGLYGAAAWAAPAGFAALDTVARGIARKAPLLLACGPLYIGLPLVALIWLRQAPEFGMATVFWLLAVVWATDTAALFVGRAVGGPKLAPVISPNKTWAGFLGGLFGALLVSLAAALWQGVLSLWPLLIAGVALSVVAQAGDLLESRIKRYLNVKDSGSVIPGHGGVFDRVDALLTAAPALAVAYVLAGGGAFLWR